MNAIISFKQFMFIASSLFLFSTPTFALTDAEKVVILQRMQNAKKPQNAKERIKNLDKQQERLAKQLKTVDDEIAFYKSQKSKECTDSSKPCVWDDVIKSTEQKRAEIATRFGKSNAKEEEVCSAKLKRLTTQNERWSKLVNELQPEKDKVNKIDESIDALQSRKKETAAKYKDDFQRAINAKQKERNKAQAEFRKKYVEAVGKDLKDIPGFPQAKNHLENIQGELQKVKALCGDVVNVNGTPTPTVTPTPTPTPDPGSSTGNL